MGYIKEPEGVDFIIDSSQLTDEDRKEISAYIQSQKRKNLEKYNVEEKTYCVAEPAIQYGVN